MSFANFVKTLCVLCGKKTNNHKVTQRRFTKAHKEKLKKNEL
jgi:hypothetical protein